MKVLYAPLIAAYIATGVCGGGASDTAAPDSDSAAGCYEHRWTRDGDGDGWGRWDPAFPDTIVWACLEAQPSGYVLADGDCDDTRPDTYPGAPDTPRDGLDSDCDGVP